MAFEFVRGPFDTEPPAVDFGPHTVKLLVGPEDGHKEFIVHKALLCASSQFFERAFSGSFVEGQTQEMKLPEENPQLFRYFVDWLYMGKTYPRSRLAALAAKIWTVDLFWLKVYSLADRIMCPGLQATAYSRTLYHFCSDLPRVPSRDFISYLFDEECPFSMQMYVVEHIAYWLPKSMDQDDWAKLFEVNDRFGKEMALAMVRRNKRGSDFLHPCKQDDFESKHGFDLRGLRAQARERDEKYPTGPEKDELQKPQLLPEPDSTASGFKRPATVMSPPAPRVLLPPTPSSTVTPPSAPLPTASATAASSQLFNFAPFGTGFGTPSRGGSGRG